ncbi:MAG: hypothetical protein IT341_00320 [Chloroflexi bacterium]|nr:hypothetical protein [Chloroflexota bacterium]
MSSDSVPPIDRRHAFAVLAVVVGLIVIGFVLWPLLAGPPSSDASPAASVSATADPSVAPSPSAAPSVTPIPTPTTEPTATPVAQWTGLAWSDPVTPAFEVHLYDLVAWNGGYVAVGEVDGSDGHGTAAFLTSPDGVDWTVAHRIAPGFGRIPRHVVTFGDELLAFSRPDTDALPLGNAYGHVVWTSTDGLSWSERTSASWQDAWADRWIGPMPAGWDPTQHGVATGLVDVASGPRSIVAIGNAFGDGAMTPIILHSTDGLAWVAASLPAGSDSALLNSVVTHDGRFVITGATGVWTDPRTSIAAAWYSDDGLTWARASVEADEPSQDVGTEFGPLWAGRDGLLTCRGNREMAAGGWRYMVEWVSTDGSAWQVDPQRNESLGCDWSAADGTRIVSLGPRDHASPVAWPGVTVARVSTDGAVWRPLELNTAITDRLERFWVVPDGVIYAGTQSFWIATAIPPEG